MINIVNNSSGEYICSLCNLISNNYLDVRVIQIDTNVRAKLSSWVSKASILGLTLCNVLYDDVLRNKVTSNSVTIGNDLTLVLTVNGEYGLMTTVNKDFCRMAAMIRSDSRLTRGKTELKTNAIIFKGKNKRDHIFFIM